MNHSTAFKNCLPLTAILILTWAGPSFAGPRTGPSGMVIELRHDVNWPVLQHPVSNGDRVFGGDIGAPAKQGFTWAVTAGSDPQAIAGLPPGLVFDLQNSENPWPSAMHGVVGDHDARFVRVFGGDMGAPSDKGFSWYETSGTDDALARVDWSLVEWLPVGTVVGLVHTENTPGRVLHWRDGAYDPVPMNSAPEHFRPRRGGDTKAPKHKGYYWFEKVDPPPSVGFDLSPSEPVDTSDPNTLIIRIHNVGTQTAPASITRVTFSLGPPIPDLPTRAIPAGQFADLRIAIEGRRGIDARYTATANADKSLKENPFNDVWSGGLSP